MHSVVEHRLHLPMSSSKPLIVLDPGHGGHDPGAVGHNGLKESDVVLVVARKLAKLLRSTVNVSLTRDADFFLSLSSRARMANVSGADLFLSIHCNAAANRSATGFEVFTSPGDTGADPFATSLYTHFAKAFPGRVQRKDLSDGDPDKEAHFTVLKKTSMPAALFELEFISSRDGEDFLSLESNLDKCAGALANGILSHLKIPNPTAPVPTLLQPPTEVLTSDRHFLTSLQSELTDLQARIQTHLDNHP